MSSESPPPPPPSRREAPPLPSSQFSLIIDIGKTLVLFMDLQRVGDRALRKLAFSHVIHSIRHVNQKHKNDPKNKGTSEYFVRNATGILIYEVKTCSCFFMWQYLMYRIFWKISKRKKKNQKEHLLPFVTFIEGESGSMIGLQMLYVFMRLRAKLACTHLQPHQRDVTNLLAAAVQACHDMVPPDAVEPLFKQIVNQFVHDKSRTEAIAVGLNVVREMRLRMPLLMTEDLLQDLVLYRKSHEKVVSSAARSLLTLFREVCPSLLLKKDRGRAIDPKAKPKAFGEVHVASNVPGVELLEQADDGDSDEDIDGERDGVSSEDDGNNLMEEEDYGDSECEFGGSSDSACEVDDEDVQDDDMSDEDDNNYNSDEKGSDEDPEEEETDNIADTDKNTSKAKKRKSSDASADTNDGILSNEDFQRIKEMKAKKEAMTALTQRFQPQSSLAPRGLMLQHLSLFVVMLADAIMVLMLNLNNEDMLLRAVIYGSSDLKDMSLGIFIFSSVSYLIEDTCNSFTRIYQANIKKKLTKDERLALIREIPSADCYKTEEGMPLAAKRAKIAKSRQQKRKLKQRSSKQFCGRKAWK
ncbi:hypothetical protein BUALT_Bualt02G0114800 [Buddleja alternifolia]|uniref:Protein SDA1 n=1 Tax=Buddleja alternifolia TaxID=168488 RepID=A0AAV6Y1I7_9LAMI|nr:hypothetical protein BUALT_Bualt02G0114800 [Buddleja alternifolia]